MKKFDLTLTVFAEKEYKGIEAENRDDAEAIAIQMFKENDYPHILVDDCVASFKKEYY